MRILILLLLTTSISLASAKTSFDRAVFFGDSLSDIGNFPEPKNYISSERIDIPLYNLYIPISSPVKSDLYGKSFNVYGTTVKWKYPDTTFLKQATTFEGLIDNHKKVYKSINWVEYLVYNNFEKNLLTSSKIYQNNTKVDKNVSIDYAWAGALSINGFGDDSQNTIKGAFKQSDLLNTRKNYISDGGSSDKIIIPGVLKQIEYYIDNINKKLVPKDINTAYFILVGANDIGETLTHDLFNMNLPNFFKKVGSTISYGTIANNVKSAVDKLIDNTDAKHIYVSSLFDLSNLPTTYNKTSNPILRGLLQGITSHVVSSYNKQLIKIFSRDEYKGIVTLLPLGQSIDKLAKETRFKHSVESGLTCIDNIYNADTAEPDIDNCNYNDRDQTYFAWNNSHLSTIVNQFMAYQVSSDINSNKLMNSDTNDSKDQNTINSLIKNLKQYK